MENLWIKNSNMTDKNSFTIQLAKKKIKIVPLYDKIKEYCKDYLVEDLDSVDFSVQVRDEDINYEKNSLVEYSDAYLETLAVYRKIAEWMSMQQTLLVHGSVVAVDGKAYLFTAKSGTGKSTHTRLWREYFGKRAVMVNDDKPLIEVSKEGIIAWGTPWDGKHHLSSNIGVPLSAICILKRGLKNTIREITPYEAYPMLMQQCYRPKDVLALEKTLTVIDEIKERVAFYELFCNTDMEAAKVAYQGMKIKGVK